MTDQKIVVWKIFPDSSSCRAGIDEEAGKMLQPFFIVVLNEIHFMQDWTATMRDGVPRKRSTKLLKHKGNLFRKNL